MKIKWGKRALNGKGWGKIMGKSSGALRRGGEALEG